jgi:hypothetical protein
VGTAALKSVSEEKSGTPRNGNEILMHLPLLIRGKLNYFERYYRSHLFSFGFLSIY